MPVPSQAPSRRTLSRNYLVGYREMLGRATDGELRDLYESTHGECALKSGSTPSAEHIQKLVQIWRELERRASLASRAPRA